MEDPLVWIRLCLLRTSFSIQLPFSGHDTNHMILAKLL